MSFRRSVPWTQQPQIPALLSGPLASGLFISIDGPNWRKNGDLVLSVTTSNVLPTLAPSIGGLAQYTNGSLAEIPITVDGPLAATAPWTLSATLIPSGNVSLSHLFGFGLRYNALKLSSVAPFGEYRALLNFNSNYYFWGANADWDTLIAFDTDGKLHTVMVVHDGTNLLFYRDGVLRASTTRPAAMIATPAGRYAVLGNALDVGGTASPNAAFVSARAWSRALSTGEVAAYFANEFAAVYAPLTRHLPAITGTISRPGTDVAGFVTGWTFTGASLAASINEPTFSDASYGEAPYSAGSAITTLDLSLAPGTYTVSFRGEYLSAAAASGQFRFTALDGSNTSLGVSSWQAVTSTVAQYDVPITVAGGTAVRLKIEIQA
jgi:hypothetical protein